MNGSKCKSTKLVPFLLLLALMQLLVIMQIHDVSTIDTHRDREAENSLLSVPTNHSIITSGGSMMSSTHLSRTTKISSDVLYPCFPPRIHTQNLQRQDYKYNNNDITTTTTIIYLETAFVDLHYETYYSFIHEICSCENSSNNNSSSKGSHWTIDTNTIPIFYIGPTDYLTVGFERVLQEYNTTTCGPIYFGKPPKNEEPNLTIVTTSYPNDFYDDSSTTAKVNEGDGKYRHLLNNPKYIFICHEDAPFLEGEDATNVYFLTPLHNRYVVPSYFPPSIVQRHEKVQHEKQQHSSIEKRKKLNHPIFLVLGSFDKKYRRNVASLEYPLKYYRKYNFTIRFMGGASSSGWPSNAKLTQQIRDRFPNDYHKIELLIRKDTDEFMDLVGEADVILPLVDGSNFYHYGNGYQGGKKLSSSIMWGLGMHKKMIIYRPLAEVFGIQEDNTTYFLHGDSTVKLAAFHEAFGRCLKHLLGESM